MLYRAIIKRKARGIFAALSDGEWQSTTKDLADDVHHVFAGESWSPEDSRDTVELTMAPLDLMEVAKRLRDDAKGGLADVEKERTSVAPPDVVSGYERDGRRAARPLGSADAAPPG